MTAFHFPVHAPNTVKKGETVKIAIGSIPASGETVEVYILDPSGRLLQAPVQIKQDVGGRTYLSAYYFNYTFGLLGTHTIFVWISTPPTPDITMGLAIVHVAPWLENIDQKISSVENIRTELQQLRTTVIRTK